MANKNKISVSILNQEHYLISTDKQEYVEQIAKLVDDRMKAIYRSNTQLSYTKIAILTALNLADDLTKARTQLEELLPSHKITGSDLEDTKEQISSLAKHVVDAEGLYDNILSELEAVKSSRSEQEQQLRLLADQLQGMCDDILDGDEALRKATDRIAELEEKLLLRESEISEYMRVFDEIEAEKLQESIAQYDEEELMYEEEDEFIYEDELEE